MKNKKIMALAITLMAIGFASVSTVLYLNGQTFVASNQGDFDVYYSRAVENGVEKIDEVIKDKTHIEFTTELTGLNEKYVLDYDVTNGSKQYDANLTMNCVGGNEYLRVENRFDTTKVLPARMTRSGRITLTVIKVPLTEMNVTIVCEIKGDAIERNEEGGEEIEEEQVDYLKLVTGDNNLWSSISRSKVENITFLNTKEGPENATLIGDVSNGENGSIMMYSKDEDNDELLEIYIGQNGGVNANPDSSHLFGVFDDLTKVDGVENLDTSRVTNMNFMFGSCTALTELDLSPLDTRNVITMQQMFYNCSNLINLNVNGFDTSKVTDMSKVFDLCYKLKSLDLKSWSFENVTNMEMMFYMCYEIEKIDVISFNTSKVTNIMDMFYSCQKLKKLDLSGMKTSNLKERMSFWNAFAGCRNLTSLNLSGWDVSNIGEFSFARMLGADSTNSLTDLNLSDWKLENITNLSGMFANYFNELVNLDLSGWDLKNVKNTAGMFYNCAKLTKTITVSGTNIESFNQMFEGSAIEEGAQITVNYTEDASDLVDQMIATKSSNSNVVKGSIVA